MIYSLKGTLASKEDGFLVVEVGGVGYKVFASKNTLNYSYREEVLLYIHTHVREDLLDLYGFLSRDELVFFEQLIGISGVGPKSALAVMDVSDLPGLAAAIQEGRPDLLTQAPGIGRKTAERLVLELRGKVRIGGAESLVKTMDSDSDIIETLVALGYKKEVARSALSKLAKDISGTEERLKSALKILSPNK